MKKCRGCKHEFEVETYKIVNHQTQERDAYCKDCRSGIRRRWYLGHKEEQFRNNKKNQRRYRDRYKIFKDSLTCMLCPETDSICLDFHHLDPTRKDISVSRAVYWSMKRLREEIRKCICVCSNCHRKIHKYGLEQVANEFDVDINTLEPERIWASLLS